MTQKNTCLPAELLANIPGFLGYYPQDSLVFVGLMHVCPNSFDIGPILRLDTSQARYLSAVGDAMRAAEMDACVGFVISPEKDPELVELLRNARDIGALDVNAVWATSEILSHGEYSLCLPPADPFFSEVLRHDPSFRSGRISEVVASATFQEMAETGNIPALNRQEAYTAFDERNQELDEETLEHIDAVAWTRSKALVAQLQCQAYAVDDFLDDFLLLLDSVAGLTPAQIDADYELLTTLGTYFAHSTLRDLILILAPDHRENFQAATRALARSYSGEIAANALCIHAFCDLGTAMSPRVAPALEKAMERVPEHRMSSLILMGYRRGIAQRLIDSALEGSRIAAADIAEGFPRSA